MNPNFITDRALSINEDDPRLRDCTQVDKKWILRELQLKALEEDNSHLELMVKYKCEILRWSKSLYYRVANPETRIRDRNNQRKRREAATPEEREKEQENLREYRKTDEFKACQKQRRDSRQRGDVRPINLTDKEMDEIGSFIEEKGVNAAARHFKIDANKATHTARYRGYKVPEKDGLTGNDRGIYVEIIKLAVSNGFAVSNLSSDRCMKLLPVSAAVLRRIAHEEGIELMDASVSDTLQTRIEGHDYLLPSDISSDAYIYSVIDPVTGCLCSNQFKPGIALCSKKRSEYDHADYYHKELDRLTTSRILCVIVEAFFLRSYRRPSPEEMPSVVKGFKAHGRTEIRTADNINSVKAKFNEAKEMLADAYKEDSHWANFALTFLDELLTEKERVDLQYLLLNNLSSMTGKAISADEFRLKVSPLLAKLDKKTYRSRPRISQSIF